MLPFIMGIGKRIRALREAIDMQQKTLAQKLNVRQATVSEWETEKHDPNPKQRAKLAKLFKVTEAELFSSFEIKNFAEAQMPVRKIPLISWVSANRFGEASDPLPPGVADKWVFTSAKGGKNMFSLLVKGDCMEPRFPEGTEIICDPEAQTKHNDFVIVRDNKNDEATFKQLRIYGDKTVLHPLNEKYQDIVIADERYQVIAKVVKKIESF